MLMSNYIKVELHGGKALQEALNALPEKTQMKFVKHAIKESSSILLSEAQSRVSTHSGALKVTLKRGNVRVKRGKISVWVETPKRDELAKQQPTEAKARNVYYGKGYYPMALEYGTSRMAARPYLRPALAAKSDKIISVFISDLRATIDEEFKK
jgi:HK97 gp10 family phage protein